jgi:hypothetical protein
VKFFIKLAILVLCAATTTVGAHAGTLSPSAFVGRWALKAEGQNLFVLALDLSNGKDEITGVLYKPAHMNLSGNTVMSVSMPVTEEKVVHADVNEDGLLLDIEDESGSVTKFQIILKSPQTADMKFVAVPTISWPLVRVAENANVAPAWDVKHVYHLGDVWPDNAQMMQLFADDQADRKRNPAMEYSQLAAADTNRRHLVNKMIRSGELRTGLDFLDAAFIFQHGEQPSDYLLAHALALSALQLGRADAGWIAAASLDRYLLSIGQPQIYGTQFGSNGQKSLDPKLIPDAFRRQMNVPALADQTPAAPKP